jgi:hypothetical protein
LSDYDDRYENYTTTAIMIVLKIFVVAQASTPTTYLSITVDPRRTSKITRTTRRSNPRNVR